MYKIKQELTEDDRMTMEAECVGTLAIPFGSDPADPADEGVFCGVSGVPRREDHQAAELRFFESWK